VRATILATLGRHSGLCLDTTAEREAIADALVAALHELPDAQEIRHLFRHAPTEGGRIAVCASHGKRLNVALEAAYRLAGGGS
jgi:hypothetical protein